MLESDVVELVGEINNSYSSSSKGWKERLSLSLKRVPKGKLLIGANSLHSSNWLSDLLLT